MKWCSRDEKNCVIKRDHKRGRGCFFGPISLIYCRWKPKKLIILGNLCQILILLTCQSPCNATQRMDYNPLNGLGWKTGRKCNLLPNFLCRHLAEEKTITGDVNELMPPQLVSNYRGTWQVRPLLFCGFFQEINTESRHYSPSALFWLMVWGRNYRNLSKTHRFSLPNQKKQKLKK